MLNQLFYIQWKDHFGGIDTGWHIYDMDFIPDPVLVNSVGFKLYETDEMICLVPHWYMQDDESPTGCGEMFILKNCITVQKELSLA